MPSTPLRDLITSDEVVFCAFCLLPQPMAVEMLARQDWDCVFIDGQHGFIDYADMLAMVVAVQGVEEGVVIMVLVVVRHVVLPWFVIQVLLTDPSIVAIVPIAPLGVILSMLLGGQEDWGEKKNGTRMRIAY